jgi:hypothetical protein
MSPRISPRNDFLSPYIYIRGKTLYTLRMELVHKILAAYAEAAVSGLRRRRPL